MEIFDNIYKLDATKTTTNVFLIKGESNILIDTGIPGLSDALLEEIKTLGVTKISDILLTHHDVDHSGNAKALQDATGAMIWVGEEDVLYLMKIKERRGIKWLPQRSYRPEPPQRYKTLQRFMKFGELTAIPAPGHTPGHFMFQLDELLFCGDMLRSDTMGRPLRMNSGMNESSEKLKQSLSMMKTLSYQWVCPSHGIPMKNDEALQQFLTRESERTYARQ
ncbi:MBL fold metallo-hydrolase [Christensenellaceae bacterium OttesenSCG-928-M15]|nr:MBL fold metallo-hydrolase [Christensenellaceae bacterium OttesenSCG-928-M15]